MRTVSRPEIIGAIWPPPYTQSSPPKPDVEGAQSPPAAHRDDSLATNPSAGLVAEDHPPKRRRGGWGRAGVFAVAAWLAWLACPTAAFAQGIGVYSIAINDEVDALEKWINVVVAFDQTEEFRRAVRHHIDIGKTSNRNAHRRCVFLLPLEDTAEAPQSLTAYIDNRYAVFRKIVTDEIGKRGQDDCLGMPLDDQYPVREEQIGLRHIEKAFKKPVVSGLQQRLNRLRARKPASLAKEPGSQEESSKRD